MSGHISVLLEEVIAALAVEPGDVVVDGTFGGGGYTAALLDAGATVIAFDRDPSAIAAGRMRFARQERLTLIEAPFDEMEAELADRGITQVNAVVFDFGVSSMQIDEADRGFSFMADGPLDMRMGEGRPVADFVNTAEAGDLADVIYQYGEERRSRHLANLIVAARKEAPITTTGQLAAIAEKALGKGQKIHPATRMFQGLRIFVNDELGQIVRALIVAERLLGEGGRLVAVTFHSLEDRIVKRFLAEASGKGQAISRHLPAVEGPAPTFTVSSKAVSPSPDEVEANPRARSSTLRAGVRTGASPAEWDDQRLSSLGAPPLVFSKLQTAWVS